MVRVVPHDGIFLGTDEAAAPRRVRIHIPGNRLHDRVGTVVEFTDTIVRVELDKAVDGYPMRVWVYQSQCQWLRSE